MRRHYTGKQRSALVDLVTTGRATVMEAAGQLGVTASTAYYWIKQAGAGAPRRKGGAPRALPRRNRALVPTTFVQVVRARDLAARITVRVGRAEVQVQRGFDAELLRAVVNALPGDAA
jgi:transposase-like protein